VFASVWILRIELLRRIPTKVANTALVLGYTNTLGVHQQARDFVLRRNSLHGPRVVSSSLNTLTVLARQQHPGYRHLQHSTRGGNNS
jgi:hypothetical protein